jgi:alpha-beta hydrolase superfamily lysophospholipase
MASGHLPTVQRFLRASIFATALLAVWALLSGCASKESVASRPELLSSGWRDAPAVAPVADFDAYVAGVTQELRTHRLPFAPSVADVELRSVAPFRIPPAQGCPPGAPRGIAVLVHGLSDTAFAMRDLASSFSRLCFESRVLLLPGHGTRPADLMVVDQRDWLAHVEAAVAQANRENDKVVLIGFSLGAALALAVAAESPDKVDAVIGLSPAYRLRSNTLARQARWVAAIRPWLDLGPREDFARYGAMPTKGIASTMAALSLMDGRVRRTGTLKTPWMVVQSEDDEVVDVASNRQFFDAHASDPRSVFVNYFSQPPAGALGSRVTWLPAGHDALRVVGLSHLALHISPDNPHYGITGTYRNCGSTPFRKEEEIRACKEAPQVWYGVGGQSPPPGEAGARATFNPHYPDLERRIGEFLSQVDGRPHRSAAFQLRRP